MVSGKRCDPAAHKFPVRLYTGLATLPRRLHRALYSRSGEMHGPMNHCNHPLDPTSTRSTSLTSSACFGFHGRRDALAVELASGNNLLDMARMLILSQRHTSTVLPSFFVKTQTRRHWTWGRLLERRPSCRLARVTESATVWRLSLGCNRSRKAHRHGCWTMLPLRHLNVLFFPTPHSSTTGNSLLSTVSFE